VKALQTNPLSQQPASTIQHKYPPTILVKTGRGSQ